MRVTLEFDLPSEAEKFQAAIEAMHMHQSLLGLEQEILAAYLEECSEDVKSILVQVLERIQNILKA